MSCGKCNTCGSWMDKCPQCNGSGVYRDGYSCKHCRGIGCICPKKGGHSSSSSGCFITTATLLATGKIEPCEELNVFRDFRDNWLLNQKDGLGEIEEYYLVAPFIVTSINAREESAKIYSEIWANDIKPCYDLILEGKFDEAKGLYSSAVLRLKNQYLRNSPH